MKRVRLNNGVTKTDDVKESKILQILSHPDLAIRELNNRSLFHFLEWAWPEISTQPFVSNWHIPYLCGELEQIANRVGERKKKKYDLLINIPPGSTKTILCSICLLYTSPSPRDS